jgi:hypothetical protein
MHDTEDRYWWYRQGERLESAFIHMMKQHGIKVKRNPNKLLEPHAADLIVRGRVADLKAQNTPFFTASRYDLSPRYTATFNRKDYERYLIACPDIYICFWINWTENVWKHHVVEPINRVFGIDFQELKILIDKAPRHFYDRRKIDVRANALSSFLLDVRDMPLLLKIT